MNGFAVILQDLYNKDIIDENVCLRSYWNDCLSELEIENNNTALANIIQTIKNCKLICQHDKPTNIFMTKFQI
jgi:hypothetical protein